MTRWRVSFLMNQGTGWEHVSRETDDEAGARDQLKGLRELMAEGEQIRVPCLERSEEPEWTVVDS